MNFCNLQSARCLHLLEPRMVGVSRRTRVSELVFALSVIFLAGCSPVYIWDTHVTATPRRNPYASAI
jgi:hypothetical protein